MNVLVVAHYYPPHLGGIENVARGQAVRLAAAGHRVTVLTSSPGAVAGTTEQDGVRVTRVATWNGIEDRTGVPFPVLGPGLLRVAWRAVRASAVVHVHDSLYLTSWVAVLCALLLRRPVVLTQHVDLVEHPSALVRLVQRVVYRSAGTLVLRAARRVMVLNGRVEEFVRAHGVAPERVVLLPNAVDTERFRPAGPGEKVRVRGALDLPDDALVTLFVGRPVPKKGFDLLVEAFAELPAPHRLVVAGGPAGDQPGWVGVGALDHARLAELYRAADLFALPSEGEGFPLTAQEAMAAGLPVLLGDDPGYAVYGLDGDLVRLVGRTAPAVRAVVAELGADADLRARMAAYSRSVAVTRFAWDAHLDALLGIYAGVAPGVAPTAAPATAPDAVPAAVPDAVPGPVPR